MENFQVKELLLMRIKILTRVSFVQEIMKVKANLHGLTE